MTLNLNLAPTPIPTPTPTLTPNQVQPGGQPQAAAKGAGRERARPHPDLELPRAAAARLRPEGPRLRESPGGRGALCTLSAHPLCTPSLHTLSAPSPRPLHWARTLCLCWRTWLQARCTWLQAGCIWLQAPLDEADLARIDELLAERLQHKIARRFEQATTPYQGPRLAALLPYRPIYLLTYSPTHRLTE